MSERKFKSRTIPMEGFDIRITGKDCLEDEIWIEHVGDTLLILTGAAAEMKRMGMKPSRQLEIPRPTQQKGEPMYPRETEAPVEDSDSEPVEEIELAEGVTVPKLGGREKRTPNPAHPPVPRDKRPDRTRAQRDAMRFFVTTSGGDEVVDLGDPKKLAGGS